METEINLKPSTTSITPPQKNAKKVSLWVSLLSFLITVGIMISLGMGVGNKFFWTKQDSKRLEQQLAYYQQMVNNNPNDPQQRVNLAFTYYELGKYQDAIQLCDSALNIDPTFYPAYLNRGYALYMLKEFDLALDAFQQAVKLSPQDYKAHMNLGIVFSALEMYEQAIEELAIAQENNPGAAEVYYYQGEILEKMENYNEAVEAYRKAIEFEPNYEKAKMALKKLGG